jgi:thymidylate synthase
VRVLQARNVNDLLVQGLELLATDGVPGQSRAGSVITAPWPVVSVYEHPTERVLFDAQRDANPFFHLMEGLWMLAGRDDSKFLNNYIQDFGDRFAESASGKENWERGGSIHDAYGRRWRRGLGFDQLDHIVKRLRSDPNDRQCVLQMWDGVETFEHGDRRLGFNDLLGNWKTRPCNTHAYFRVREVVSGRTQYPISKEEVPVYSKVLDMTILCRSNDIIWGAYGANAVHFSMLQEYLAGRLGIAVGKMYQFSNNYHAYVDALDRMGDPVQMPDSDRYDDATVYSISMGTDWSKWDEDLRKFMRWHNWLWDQTSEHTDISVGVANQAYNAWFDCVPVRVAQSRWLWKRGRREEAYEKVKTIAATDWRMACQQWMERRL